MASPPIPPCPHELRPGITVCLRCQHAERGAKRAKQRLLFARGGAAALMLAAIAAVGIAAITALRGRVGAANSGRAPAAAELVASPSEDSTSSEPMDAPSAGAVASAGVANGAASRGAAVAGTTLPMVAAVPGAARAVAPLVPVGRTTLRDTMVAERAGDTVRVSFDLLMMRTRRPDKFEAIVRSTLPQVYGATADSALRALPFGAVARAGDLITLLPEHGFHIPLAGGRTIRVWPVTREGRDGPLVVAYRALASR